MAYIKPQYPLKNGDNYLYPVTTHDQILLDDGSRWDGDVGVKSVDGKTGAVTLDYPVDSVNGQTDAVMLTYSDVRAAAASHTHNGIVANSGANTWMFDDDSNGVGIQVGYNSSRGTFNIGNKGTGVSIWDSKEKNSGTIYTTGNLTFSLSGTTLTITKS